MVVVLPLVSCNDPCDPGNPNPPEVFRDNRRNARNVPGPLDILICDEDNIATGKALKLESLSF